MLRPFLLLLVAICFSVTGELMLKTGMNKVGVLSLQPSQIVASLWRTFTNPYVLGGFTLVFTGSIFWLAVISRAPLSWAYPLLSISYILGIALSWLLLGESVTLSHFAGAFMIVAGVFVIYRS